MSFGSIHISLYKIALMPRWIFIVSFLFCSLFVHAQFIRIIDAENGAPIERVLIYEKGGTQSILTDETGKADITGFRPGQELIFQHPSYEIRAIYYSKLPPDLILRLKRKTIQLSELIVSASKWEQDRSEVPERIASIGPAEIRLENPQTSADVLQSSGEVFVQKSQLGGGSPMIRGFAANAVLIVVDGVRMNNAIFRSGNLQNIILIDPFIIDNAEVIFGPGSVMYGSDALGGVMDFHTLDPALSYDSTMNIRAENISRFSSANQEFTDHFQFNIGGNRLASLTSITYSSFGHLRAGANHPADYPDFGKRVYYQDYRNGKDTVITNSNVNEQIASAYKQLNINQKLRFRIDKHWDLQYAFTYSGSTDVPRYDRLTEWKDSLPSYGEWYYGPQLWMMHQLRIKHRAKTFFYDQARIIFSRQDMEESRHDRKFNNEWLRHRTEKLSAFNLNIEVSKSMDALNLYYGIEANTNDISSEGFKENIRNGVTEKTSSRYPDGENRYKSFAAYAQLKYKPSDALTLHSGLRYSFVYSLSTIDDNSFYNLPYDEIKMKHGALNGSIGLVYKLTASWHYKLNFSSGFRSPNLDDLAKVFDSEPGNVLVPNPDLGPEYAYNIESGLVFTKTDNIVLEMDAFYTIVKDVMVRRDYLFNGQDSIIYDGTLSKVQSLVNGESARIYGLSFNGFAQLSPEWSISQSISWMDGYETDTKLPLRHTSPVFGRTSLRWKNKFLTLNIYTAYNGWKRWNNLSPTEQAKPDLYTIDGSPAWITFNLKANARISNALEISLGLENILDRHYRPYSSGISAAGRNLIMSVRIKI